jgi:microcompartment protein CcmL/EutN
MGQAVGLLEVYGLVTAFVAADAACKAANVTIEPFDKNKPANADKLPVPLIILVKMRGSVADVREAMAAGENAANSVAGIVASHIISRPDEETEKMLRINEMKG